MSTSVMVVLATAFFVDCFPRQHCLWHGFRKTGHPMLARIAISPGAYRSMALPGIGTFALFLFGQMGLLAMRAWGQRLEWVAISTPAPPAEKQRQADDGNGAAEAGHQECEVVTAMCHAR